MTTKNETTAPFRLKGPFPPSPGCQGMGSTLLGACYCHGRRYTCPGCLRFIPFCYGAADEHAAYCDDCYGVLKRREGNVHG
jgi:hypothetical protein